MHYPPATTPAEHVQRMREIRDRDGVRAVLIYLNSLTEHRFTALLRFHDDEQLRSAYFYDRQRPELESCPEIPIPNSYCVFVRQTGDTFTTLDSLADDRVADHPKRLEVRSYCGVPLVDAAGRLLGTICHFDPRPLPLTPDDVALLEAVAPLLPVPSDPVPR